MNHTEHYMVCSREHEICYLMDTKLHDGQLLTIAGGIQKNNEEAI